MLHRLEDSARIMLRFVDDEPSARHLTTKVLERLEWCSLAIFDLSEWNPNVALEFGICEGLVRGNRRNVWLLLDTTKSKDVPSDIQGLAQIRYTSLEGLEKELGVLLTARFPKSKRRDGISR